MDRIDARRVPPPHDLQIFPLTGLLGAGPVPALAPLKYP